MGSARKDCVDYRSNNAIALDVLGCYIHTVEHRRDTVDRGPVSGHVGTVFQSIPFAYDSQGWGIWIPQQPKFNKLI